MAKIVFYCRDSLDNILAMEYYRQDIQALRALGNEVIICNRYRDIPWQFDVMYVWWWTYALVPVLFARLLGRLSMVTGVYNFRFEHKSYGADYFARPWHQRLLISLATRLTDANLFVSEREFNEVPAYFKLKESYYFPCAIDEEYFSAGQTMLPRAGLLNIAWSGTENLKRKGVWDILEAMALLKKRKISVSLTLAGKQGDAYPKLHSRIAELGLEDVVTAVGEISQHEKLKLFSSTKLYLQPSYFEGFGLATAEAMASGCCVITCDVGEVRNVVGNGGLYVHPGRPVELANAIEALLADQGAIDNLNRDAAERMKDLFSFHRKVQILRSALQKITKI